MMTTNNLNVKISLDYLSEDGKILELIKFIANKNDITGKLKKEKDNIQILISDQQEKVEKFLDELGKYMPVSIFMKEAKTEILEEIDEKLENGFKIENDINILPQNLSPCPFCLEELTNPDSRRFHFPFISCSFCGHHYSYLYEYPFEREKTVFKFFVMCENCQQEFNDKENRRYKYPLTSCHTCLTPIYLKKGENERYGFDPEKSVGAFKTASGVLEKGNILKVYTANGEKFITILKKENIELLKQNLNITNKDITLLITNLAILNDIAYVSSAEIKALASIEKPTVILQAKDFEGKDLISKTGFINVKLPDDPVLTLLSLHLKDRGINYVVIFDANENSHEITDFEFNADLPVINKQKETKLFVAQNKNVIVEGEKGIIPAIIKSKPTGNLSIAGDYAVLDLGNGEYLIDKKDKLLYSIASFVDEVENLITLNGSYEYIEVPYKNTKSFKAYEGAILSTLAEKNILDDAVVGLYFSSKFNTDVIAVKTKIKPLKPLVWIRPVRLYKDQYKTAKWILEQIKNSSEEGERQYNNYKNKFKETFEILEKLELDDNYKEVSSITAIFNSIAILTQMFQGNSSYFEEPYIHLQTESLDYKGAQGLKVDYELDEEEGIFYLNWIKLVQSVLSYKLAEVDNKMIAFSIFEGLADWLIDHIIKVITKLNIDNIALTGSFFANPVLTGRIIKHFSGKKNILINEKLPIDEQNIAFGGIFKEVS